MVDILIEGNNDSDFIKDLQNQIARFVVDSRFVSVSPDVIIVDEKSESFIRLRQKYPQTPIIFLCHDNDTDTTNLNITIKKPFSLAQFLDVLQAANHKLDSSVDGYLRFNDFELRPQKKELTDLKNNISYKLTEKEVKIIKYLYKNTDKYVDKTALQTNVWQYNQDASTHTIETHIYRLRQKVEQTNHQLIATNNGGYKLLLRGNNA